MNESCNLCCRELNGVTFNLKTSKSEHSDIFLISLLESLIENHAILQNITSICMECNEILLELDVIRCRMVEIQNILGQYIEKRQHALLYLTSSNFNTNDKDQHLLDEQDNEIQEIEIFENIIESECQVIEEDLMNDSISHESSQNIGQHESTGEDNEKKPESVTNRLKPEHLCHCMKSFRTKAELKKHINTHNSERPYVCEICGHSYKYKTGFETHMNMHEGLNPFTCVYCNKSFTQKVALIRHVPMHTGEKPFQCEECGKRFTHHTSFSSHKLIHTGKKPYKCSHCCEAFRSSSHLTRHNRVHTGEKKFGCETCGKRFAERYNLSVHQKVHTNNEGNVSTKGKHSCQICGERFERPAKLDEHKIKIHFSAVTEPFTQVFTV